MYTILIVDDEFPARRLMHMLIEPLQDFSIIAEADNGEDALELWRKLKPDVLLTDIEMPQMNGLDLIESVRKENPDQLIVILSCYESFSYAQRAMRLGVKDYLVKDMTTQAEMEKCLYNLLRISAAAPGTRPSPEKEQGEDHKTIVGIAGVQQKQIEHTLERISYHFFSGNAEKTISDLRVLYLTDIAGMPKYHLLQYLNELIISWILAECVRCSVPTEEIFSDAASPLSILDAAATPGDACDRLCKWIRELFQRIDGGRVISNRIRNIINYINVYYYQNLTLQDIADHFNIHPVYLSRSFKEEMGVNLSSYINYIRVEKAKLLLCLGTYRTNEIAYTVGFNNTQSFYNAFKKNTGYSPSDYSRKSGRDGEKTHQD